jgi:hypothetical protein
MEVNGKSDFLALALAELLFGQLTVNLVSLYAGLPVSLELFREDYLCVDFVFVVGLFDVFLELVRVETAGEERYRVFDVTERVVEVCALKFEVALTALALEIGIKLCLDEYTGLFSHHGYEASVGVGGGDKGGIF